MSRGQQDDILFGERWPSVVHAPAVNVAAVASRPGEVGKRHLVEGVTISATAAPGAAVEVTLQLGAVVVERIKLPAAAFAPILLNFRPPYAALENEAVTLTIPQLGAAVAAAAVLRGRSLSVK